MVKVGQKLQEARLEKCLSLDEVAQQTKIRYNFLSAIEKGEYSKLPSVAYAQGFVRNYARFLGLPEKETLALFRREFDENKNFNVLPNSLTKNKDYLPAGIKIKQSWLIICLIFIVVFGFIFYQFRSNFFNPQVYIISPKDNAVVNSTRLVVLGKTDANTTVTVNNLLVAIDGSGEFRKVISVFPGKSTITIKVINKFGRQTVIKKEVVIKPTT
jgi:cytoskeletal protein RodZ